MIALNVGSGQRPFGEGWINIDKTLHEGMPRPDHLYDGANLPDGWTDRFDYVCLHHTLEHSNLTDGGNLVREANRVLKPNGSLLIFLPDMRALAQRWLDGGISDYIFFVNAMGAWMGHDEDYHRWHYTPTTLVEQLNNNGEWSWIKRFDWRHIPGADIAQDWWIQGWEATK